MPYTCSDLSSLLTEEIIHADVDENPPDDYDDPAVAFFVIGKEDFDEDEIEKFIEKTRRKAAFLPQEGFLQPSFGARINLPIPQLRKLSTSRTN